MRPPPLAILRARSLNSGPGYGLWLSATSAVMTNGGRQSRDQITAFPVKRFHRSFWNPHDRNFLGRRRLFMGWGNADERCPMTLIVLVMLMTSAMIAIGAVYSAR